MASVLESSGLLNTTEVMLQRSRRKHLACAGDREAWGLNSEVTSAEEEEAKQGQRFGQEGQPTLLCHSPMPSLDLQRTSEGPGYRYQAVLVRLPRSPASSK